MRKLILCLFCLLPGSASAQEQVGAEYRLGPGDVIQVQVINVEGYVHDVQLSNEGEILLPHLGKVSAAGRTPSELSLELAAAMNDTLFRDPSVSVTIKEYRSNPILLMGAVHSPGIYQKIRGSYKLIDLLSEAGGVLDSAGDLIRIQRRGEGTENQEAIELAMSDLYGARLNTLNFELESGDVVTIPPRDNFNPNVYFVIGEVGRPGDYVYPAERELNIAQAISAAGGPLKTAKADKGILVRYNEDGSQAQIPFSLVKMLKGQQASIKVEPQDILFIPGSNAKTIMYGLLGVIPNTVQQATTSGLNRP